jgi:MFS transporter, DHA1 family, multidrug resistance protein
MNLFLPSLPGMAEYFDAPYQQIQLTVSLYMFVSAILMIIVGPLSDKFGRRPVILWGMLLFLLATIGCMVSPTVEVFLAFRMAQSVVVVGLAISRASIRDSVPAAEAASLIGYVTMGMAIAPMLAPAVGGALDEAFGWQSSFAMLAVIGFAVLVLSWLDLGETAPKSDNSIFQQFKEYPELLKARRFWAYALTNAFSSGAFFAYLGGAPFVGAVVYNLSPMMVGATFAAPSIGYATGNFLAGRFSARLGIMPMILAGVSSVVAGLGIVMLLFLSGFGSFWLFLVAMVFVGLGNGMTIPNATSAMLSVRPKLAGTASGLGGAIMTAGGAGLSAYAGTLLTIESGATPLLVLMFASSVASGITALYARARDKKMDAA